MAGPDDRPFIRIHPMFFLMAFMLGGADIQNPPVIIGWMLVVFVSVLVHELGHAAMARAFGFHPWIELHAMGGTTFYERSTRVQGVRRIAISLAGPFAGFALGGSIILIEPHLPPLSPLLSALVDSAKWVNIGWGLFNLFPILPLDGGHVMESLALKVMPQRGAIAARWISIALGAGVAIPAAFFPLQTLAFLMGVVASVFGPALALEIMKFEPRYIALLFGFFVISNFIAARAAAKAIPNRQPAPAPTAAPPPDGSVETSIRNGDAATAVAQAKARVGAARTPEERREAARLLVYAYYANQEFNRARVVLETMLDGKLDDPFLVGNIYMGVDDYERAVEPLRAAHAAKASKETGRWLVRALARSGRIDEAKALLEGADSALYTKGAFHDVGEALFRAKQYEACVDWEERMVTRWGDPVAAYNVACSMAQLGRVDDGISWIEQAVDRGFNDGELLDSDEDIAPLRADRRFGAIRSRVRGTSATAQA